jgi:hypothetical protein
MTLAKVQMPVRRSGPWRAAGDIGPSRLVGLLVSPTPENRVEPENGTPTSGLPRTSVLSSLASDLSHQAEAKSRGGSITCFPDLL